MRQRVEISVEDGTTMPAYCARPDGAFAPVGVVVAHELFGVNPDIRSVVDEIAAAGHVVLAPEFYHRDAEAGRYLSRDDAGRDEGFALLHKMTRAGAVADVRAAVSVLADRYAVREAAIVGFSAGGHLAYLAAATLPIARAAILYGGWLPSTDIPLSQPEPTLDLTPGISGELLFIVGGDDFLIGSDQVDKISAALRLAEVRHEMVIYPGVQHAFFWPDTPAFDRDARDDATRKILALLAR
ncbi:MULTISPECIES: dienelactone hydrolase family protein [Pseudofrankia]|uniref:dienelactone hydrolase family protein n=1 Tax=Pseudofrankia TaxID=2994363 RepID=UPI000234BC9C|nr:MULTISPECIES: dienelactone hydrolase family protein [Pseudofrankia]OHV30105.1 carboxymethylenebutenolidase [Pseudofrankia sp. EUN1h]